MKSIFIILILSIALPVFSQPVTLDNLFGEKGIATLDYGHLSSTTPKMIIQPDGKIVMIGTVGVSKIKDDDLSTVIVRFNVNGTPDLSFNHKGYTIIRYGINLTWGRSLALQHDGKIIVAGEIGIANSDNLLVRLNTNGSIDSTFGEKGYTIADVGEDRDVALSITIQKDDKILLIGKSAIAYREMNLSLLRFTPDGSPDESFGEKGKVILKRGWFMDADVLQLQDRKILLSASTYNNETKLYDLILAKYLANGILDYSFGDKGITYTTLNNNESAVFRISVQKDGKILASGNQNTKNASAALLMRFNKNGRVDSSFGNKGSVSTYVSVNDIFNDLTLQKDNKIIVAGKTMDKKNHSSFLIMRYNNNGSVDKSFGSNGKVITVIGDNDAEAFSVRLYNNKIIAAGQYWNKDWKFAVAKYKYTPNKKQLN